MTTDKKSIIEIGRSVMKIRDIVFIYISEEESHRVLARFGKTVDSALYPGFFQDMADVLCEDVIAVGLPGGRIIAAKG